MPGRAPGTPRPHGKTLYSTAQSKNSFQTTFSWISREVQECSQNHGLKYNRGFRQRYLSSGTCVVLLK